MNKNNRSFYNNHYKSVQNRLTPWYSFMLPELIKDLKDDSKILEIGCGQSIGLRYLANNNYIKGKNIFGVDQSDVAIRFLKKRIPSGNFKTRDVHKLKYPDNFFDCVLLMEVFEHLEQPKLVLNEIRKILKPEGKLFLSFPNYINIPWLFLRIIAEKFNKPNWIILQPIDKIYMIFQVINYCRNAGLNYKSCVGSNYFPPLIYKIEPRSVTLLFNKLRLSYLSLHPILIFQK